MYLFYVQIKENAGMYMSNPLVCAGIFVALFLPSFAGYRTFCVFFNANGASVYRASLAFIFSEMIFEGGQKVL